MAIFAVLVGIAAIIWRDRQLEAIPPVSRPLIQTNPDAYWEIVNETRAQRGLPPVEPHEIPKYPD